MNGMVARYRSVEDIAYRLRKLGTPEQCINTHVERLRTLRAAKLAKQSTKPTGTIRREASSKRFNERLKHRL